MKSTPPIVDVLDAFRDLVAKRDEELSEKVYPQGGMGRPKRLSSLLRHFDNDDKKTPKPSSKPVDALTEELRAHPGCQWLMQSVEFKRAIEIFLTRRKCESDPYANALGEIRFFDRVLLWLGFCLRTNVSGWRPKSVSASDKRAAHKHALALLDSLDNGVKLSNFAETDRLKHLLTSLCTELTCNKKRDYAGNSRERWVLTHFSVSLLGLAGVKPADVVDMVYEVASLYGLKVSTRTIQRYVRDAIQQHNEMWAQPTR